MVAISIPFPSRDAQALQGSSRTRLHPIHKYLPSRYSPFAIRSPRANQTPIPRKPTQSMLSPCSSAEFARSNYHCSHSIRRVLTRLLLPRHLHLNIQLRRYPSQPSKMNHHHQNFLLLLHRYRRHHHLRFNLALQLISHLLKHYHLESHRS